MGTWCPRVAVGRGHEGHQLLDAGQGTHRHGHGRHARLRGNGPFDLAQFHAEAADLHLVVGAAQVVQLARGIDPSQIAGAIHPRVAGPVGQRIGDEPLGRQFRLAEITDRHARPENADLAGLPDRQGPELGIDDQQSVVGQRRADRHRLSRLQSGQAGRDGGLGRPVGIEERPPRPGQAIDQCLRAGLAAEVDQPHRGQRIVDQAHQGRHGMHHGDPLPGDRRGDPLGVGDAVGRRDPERGADKVRNPDLLERHVEGHREALIDHVVFTNAEDFVLAPQKMADAAMIDDDPFRLPRRARGVDGVCRIGGVCEIAGRPAGLTVRVLQQVLDGPKGRRTPRQPGNRLSRRNQSAGAGRTKTKLDAAAGRGGIQGQPGGAALGNPRLGDQQLGSPRQVQADHRAALRPAGDQFAGHGIAAGVEFRVGHDPIAPDQGRMIGPTASGGSQDVTEAFLAQQIGA